MSGSSSGPFPKGRYTYAPPTQQKAPTNVPHLRPYKLVGSEYLYNTGVNRYADFSSETKNHKAKSDYLSVMYKKASSDYGSHQTEKHLKIRTRTVPQEFSRSFPTEYRPNQFPMVVGRPFRS